MGGARIIGDMRNPDSQISRMLEEHRSELMVLLPEKNTFPQVFYLGMDERFVTRPQAEPVALEVLDPQGQEMGYEFHH